MTNFSWWADGSIVGLSLAATMAAGILVRRHVDEVEHVLIPGESLATVCGLDPGRLEATMKVLLLAVAAGMLTWSWLSLNDILASLRRGRPWPDRTGLLENRLLVAAIGSFLLLYGLRYPLCGETRPADRRDSWP